MVLELLAVGAIIGQQGRKSVGFSLHLNPEYQLELRNKIDML